MKEKGFEEAIYRRADYWVSEAGRVRCTGQGVMPAARIQRCIILSWRAKFGGMSVPDAKRLRELEAENSRLKKLLAESILDAEALKVALGRKR